jgi:hypothetical protein
VATETDRIRTGLDVDRKFSRMARRGGAEL